MSFCGLWSLLINLDTVFGPYRADESEPVPKGIYNQNELVAGDLRPFQICVHLTLKLDSSQLVITAK